MKTDVYFIIWFAISKKRFLGGDNVQTLKHFELNFSDEPSKTFCEQSFRQSNLIFQVT